MNALTEALGAIETTPRTTEQRGVWTVTGRGSVTARVVDFVEATDEEVIYASVEALLADGIVERLRRASERGVSIRLAGGSAAVADAVREEVPDAETFASLWDWTDEPAGRLLMVDRERTLVSVLVDGEHPSEPLDETAI